MKHKKDIYCPLDEQYHSIISLTRLLKKLDIDQKEYYDTYLKGENEGNCFNCGKPTKFLKFRYYKFCNPACSVNFNKPIEKFIKKCAESKDYKTEKYALMVENRNKNDPGAKKAMEKRKKTYIEKYGISESEFREKQWNDFYSSMTEDEHNEYFDKLIGKRSKHGSYKYKEYVLGDRTVLIQGYKNYVLDILLELFEPSEMKIGHENDIIYYKDKINKKRRYLPDITKDRILIEVKSKYTLEKNYEVTMRKLKASKDAGYIPILVVWDKKKAEQLKKILIETISSQALMHEGRFNDYPFIGVGFK